MGDKQPAGCFLIEGAIIVAKNVPTNDEQNIPHNSRERPNAQFFAKTDGRTIFDK